MAKMTKSGNTIGSKDCAPFAQRGSKKPMSQWTDYPRVTKSPQQFGFGVTPQNMVQPATPGQYRAGRRFPEMNVGRPRPERGK